MLILPPAFSIFDKACLETKWADISRFFLISPVPKIFNFLNFLFTSFFSFSIFKSRLVLMSFLDLSKIFCILDKFKIAVVFLFNVGTSAGSNGSGQNFIAYCFAEKTGYSKFGIYTGNGNANGTFVYTGFKPALVMIKSTGNAENWFIFDNKM